MFVLILQLVKYFKSLIESSLRGIFCDIFKRSPLSLFYCFILRAFS